MPTPSTTCSPTRCVRTFTTHLSMNRQSPDSCGRQRVTAGGRKTAPSAGALSPSRIYVATPGSLRRTSQLPMRPWSSSTRPTVARRRRDGQQPTAAAPTLIVITGVVARTAVKYGDRAERYVHLEAGHVCQNLLLEATALGLAAVPIGAFSDDDLRAALGIGPGEAPLVVPIGHPGPTRSFSGAPPTEVSSSASLRSAVPRAPRARDRPRGRRGHRRHPRPPRR